MGLPITTARRRCARECVGEGTTTTTTTDDAIVVRRDVRYDDALPYFIRIIFHRRAAVLAKLWHNTRKTAATRTLRIRISPPPMIYGQPAKKGRGKRNESSSLSAAAGYGGVSGVDGLRPPRSRVYTLSFHFFFTVALVSSFFFQCLSFFPLRPSWMAWIGRRSLPPIHHLLAGNRSNPPRPARPHETLSESDREECR